ncbi:hypothetical protein EVAR_72458_1 [Eumeta japonica]|uniref:Uncharacterized protein n=1 Tax=Eumeta variegata TaxID=151549 RepID=A0A4C1TB27_EUMVA|nr:hypothetical protein EVAR_72458_1 [Eumeta japonica]
MVLCSVILVIVIHLVPKYHLSVPVIYNVFCNSNKQTVLMPSHAEDILNLKSRNLEFERAKQKFDNPAHLQHQHHHRQREQRERSSGRYGPNNSSGGIGSGRTGATVANPLSTPNSRANLALP